MRILLTGATGHRRVALLGAPKGSRDMVPPVDGRASAPSVPRGGGKPRRVHPHERTPREPSGKTTAKRHFYFSLALATACALAAPPLALFGISFRSDYYSHVPLIPLVSVYLLYQRRTTLFDGAEYEPRWGCPVAAAGLVLYAPGIWGPGLSQHDASSLMIFSSLLFLFGAFVCFYGTRTFMRSAFPFLFLLFMVPVPSALMGRIIYFLQAGSAEVTDMIFKTTGIPHLREGLVFHLPRFSIEVAKECSGIRSSLALLITVVLAAHFFLRTSWQKAVLVFSIFPIVLVKNGIRISVLTFLGTYVDQRILTEGFLHRSGGIFFFIPALALMGIILWALRSVNGDHVRPTGGASSAVAQKSSG